MKIIKWIKDEWLFILILIAVVMIGQSWVFHYGQIIGRSMEPNVVEGDIYFSSILLDYDYGDIIVVERYDDDKTYYVIKRVIGLPNDEIICINNDIYRNGAKLEEDYIKDDYRIKVGYKKVQLGDDEIFIAGDNRYVSLDSRDYGAVKTKDVKGKIFFIIK